MSTKITPVVLPDGLAVDLKAEVNVNKDNAKTLRLHRNVYDAVADLLMAGEVMDYGSNELKSDLKAKAAESWGVAKGSMDNRFPAGWFFVTAVKEVRTERDEHSLDGTTIKVTFVLRSGAEKKGSNLLDFIKEVRANTGKKFPADQVREWIRKADGSVETLKSQREAFENGLAAAEAKIDPRPAWVTSAATSMAALPDDVTELPVDVLAPLMVQIQRLSAMFSAIEAEGAAIERAKEKTSVSE